MRTNSTVLKSDFSESIGNDAVGRIRAVLQAHGRLGVDAMQIGEDHDLYAAGMTSLASVNVMLALEAAFNIEFPDQMLNRSVFASIGAIEAAVRKIECA